MPNLAKMGQAQDEMDKIDKALRHATLFTDGKTFFETSKGRELCTRQQLEALRVQAEQRLVAARWE